MVLFNHLISISHLIRLFRKHYVICFVKQFYANKILILFLERCNQLSENMN